MSTETTNKKIKIDNGTTFGRTYTDKAVDERLQGLVSTATFTPVKEKANNSLQKPKGLTKTELVGVGTNGQENIEIGDNLTLANGKLSATGGNEINVLNVNDNTFTGFIEPDKINLIKLNDYISLVGIGFVTTFANILFGFAPDMDSSGTLTGDLTAHLLIQSNDLSEYKSLRFNLSYYSHFITLSSTTIGSINFNFYNTSYEEFTIDRLKQVLAGKFNTCSGYINDSGNTRIAQYIAGESDGLTIRWFGTSNGSSGSTIIDNTFSISDNVSLVGD